MFKQLMGIFRKDSLMDQSYKRSFQMLEITREMFLKAKKSLRHTEDNLIDIDIYNKDIEVNKYEREVRRNVLNHLILSGKENLPQGLVLVSIIIDIERIGDYTKNIVELALNHPDKLEIEEFETDLLKIEKAVNELFEQTQKCFMNSDTVLGLKLIKKYKWINRLCDESILKLVKMKGDKIIVGDAVTLALYFRWLKRINSHLRNIVTSVVNPFDRIGFKPKKKLIE
ncbi:MAG: PhoU domain-containing protein [bacterium]|nr:MAG: PhoU domain-containing protein [bacterium]